MSRVRSHRGVAGKRTLLGVGAGGRRRPTHGRQGKRPALGAAHVVGKIEKFTNATNTRCWRFLQIVQAFQSFGRRRSELLRAAACFPDALVGILPDAFEVIEEQCQHAEDVLVKSV